MKYLAILLFLVNLNSYAAESRILMLISTGFYAPEYYTPRTTFDAKKLNVTVAAKYSGLVYPDRRNVDFDPVNADITFDKVKVDNYDAVVFAGGNGAWEDFFPNEDVHKILTQAMNKNKVVALLCTATGLLGLTNNFAGTSSPLAQGRNVTGYKRVEGILKVLGKVNYSPGEKDKPHVVVDGNLITGRDPLSADLFAKTILKELN